MERIRDSGELVVGIDPSYPPFETIDGAGGLAGFDVDLAHEVARRLGAKPRFVAVDVGGIHDALLARKLDVIISSLPPYPELSKQISFSRAYFNAGQVLVVRDDATLVGGIEDLSGRVVAVEVGSTADLETRSLDKTFSDVDVRRFSTPVQALEEVRSGRVDAAIVDGISAFEFIAGVGGVKLVGSPITLEPYVVSTRIADAKLTSEVDRIIGELEQDGTLDVLRARWLGDVGK